ncbi:MAG: TolC family protein [Holosporaceae bacterium]|jgi:TolC family type I secretion outer membrane protein|nr:TolC family protein [Holosporaceae bacterium]
MKVLEIFVLALAVSCVADASCKDKIKKSKATASATASAKEAINVEDPITFDAALRGAYKNNQEWLANNIEKNIADEKLNQAKKSFLPDVSANIRASRSKKKDKESYINSGEREEKPSQTSMGIRIHQNIFNGFSNINSMRSQEHESDAAFHRLKANEEKLISDTIEKYAAVWVAQQKVLATKKMEDNLHQIVLSHKNSLDVGYGTSAEISAAKASYQEALFNRINAETELYSAKSEFKKLTGLSASENMKLPEFNIQLPKTVDELVAKAKKSNHRILFQKEGMLAAEKAHKAAIGSLSPRCDLELSADRSLSKDVTTPVEPHRLSSTTCSAALTVTMPIFSNGSNGDSYSAIKIARQSELKACLMYEESIQEVEKDCIICWNNYNSANALIAASRSAVQSAEHSSNDNMEETNMGMKSNVDVWDKENRLYKARENFAESQQKKVVMAIKLKILTGELDVNTLLSLIKTGRGSAE